MISAQYLIHPFSLSSFLLHQPTSANLSTNDSVDKPCKSVSCQSQKWTLLYQQTNKWWNRKVCMMWRSYALLHYHQPFKTTQAESNHQHWNSSMTVENFHEGASKTNSSNARNVSFFLATKRNIQHRLKRKKELPFFCMSCHGLIQWHQSMRKVPSHIQRKGQCLSAKILNTGGKYQKNFKQYQK